MTNDTMHFAIAQTQYNVLLGSGAKQVTSVDYYDNPAVKQQYDTCVQQFSAAGKDVNPLWIFHGTAAATVPLIMQHGFKVGGGSGKGAVAVANGSAYGVGVYSATGPGTPMGCEWPLADTPPSSFLILCFWRQLPVFHQVSI